MAKHHILLISNQGERFSEPLQIILGKDFVFFSLEKKGEEISEYLVKNLIDLIFLDIHLRGWDVFKVLEKIKKIDSTLPVIVIALAPPSVSPEMTEEILRAGAYGFISDLFKQAEIRSLIINALEKRHLSQKIKFLSARLGQYEGKEKSRHFFIKNTVQDDKNYVVKGTYYYQEIMRKFSHAIIHISDLEKVLESLVELIVEAFRANKVIFFLRDMNSKKYVPRSSFGFSKRLLNKVAFHEKDSLIRWMKENNQLIKLNNLLDSISWSEGITLKKEIDLIGSNIVLPLNGREGLLGFIGIGKKVTGEDYSREDLEILLTISLYGAIAIENTFLYQRVSLQKEYIQNVLDNVPTGVISIDNEGMITTINKNAEKILQVKSEDVLGESVQKLGSTLAHLLLTTIKEGRVFNRHEIINPITKAPLGASTSFLSKEGQDVAGAIMVFSDLSEAKLMEKKALELERVKFWNFLVSRIAHEIKNPLVAINSFTQLLPEKYQEETFRNFFHKVVSQELDRLNKIVEQLLSFATHHDLHPEETEINSFITEILDSFQYEIGLEKAKTIKDFWPEPLVSSLDRRGFREALSYILKNSLEAKKEGVDLNIKISTRKQGDMTEIEIRDDGTGIDPDVREKVFLPFFTTKNKGFGLGLPIAKRIIEDHGGTVSLGDDTKEGCSIKIRLAAINKGETNESKI
jgi:nitrogen-specific signal transduction histidine kinase/CheY-like chemotaxis protein